MEQASSPAALLIQERGGREKVAAAPPAPCAGVLPRKLSNSLLQAAQPKAAPCGCSAGKSRELPAAPHKVSCERPPAVKVRGAGQPGQEGGVGGSFPAPGDPRY